MTGLEFNPNTHTYTYRGRRIPSVTQLLDSFGLITGQEWFRPEHAERGQAVHAGIHLLHEGTLDWSTVAPSIAPYLAAYEQFEKDFNLSSYLSEKPLASERYFYAGTFDFLGWAREKLVLIDFKSGLYSAWMDIQLELYHRLLMENADALGLDHMPEDHMIVQLRNDGSYKIHERVLTASRIASITNSILTINLFREGRLAA